MNKKTILTGITTTGRPHLGNYTGAIRPAIEASLGKDLKSFYFLADHHSLIKNKDPNKISIKLWPTSQLIKKGHRIRLEISSSNYTRLYRNPNTGNTIHNETKPEIATQTIYHGKSYPSHILLPLILD